ncbi:MAG: hypothetical protein ACOYK5_03955 [Bacteroidia bacterium]
MPWLNDYGIAPRYALAQPIQSNPRHAKAIPSQGTSLFWLSHKSYFFWSEPRHAVALLRPGIFRNFLGGSRAFRATPRSENGPAGGGQ